MKFYSYFLESPDIEYLLGADAENVKRASAVFLLKMKEQRRVSQVAIDDIVENSRSIFNQTLQRVEVAVKAKVAESGYDPDSINGRNKRSC